MVSLYWQTLWARDHRALITIMPAALRSCMAVKMGVASRRSMWCWTAMATDSCRHTRWLRHTLAVRWRVWSRWATPSTSLEENLPAPPSVGSAQTRPAAKVRSQISKHCGNFLFTCQPSAGECCVLHLLYRVGVQTVWTECQTGSDQHSLYTIFISCFYGGHFYPIKTQSKPDTWEKLTLRAYCLTLPANIHSVCEVACRGSAGFQHMTVMEVGNEWMRGPCKVP